MLIEYLHLRRKIFIAACLKKRENNWAKHTEVRRTDEQLLHYLCYRYVQ